MQAHAIPHRDTALRGRGIRALALAAVLLSGAVGGAVSAPPQTAVAAATPKAYVGLYGDDAIGVLDVATGRIVRTIKVAAGPEAVIVAPGGGRVYVSSEDATSLSVIDTASDAVTDTIDVGKFPEGMALSRDGETLVVGVFGTNQVDVIDTSTLRITKRYTVGMAHGVTLAPDGKTAYVGSQVPGHNAIVVLDLATGRAAARVQLAQAPRGLFVSPDAKSLYFTLANSAEVNVLDRATNTVTAHITVGPIPHQMAFTPDHKNALVVVQGAGQLAVVDLASHEVTATIRVGNFPHWVGITSDGTLAYVTNEGDDTVSVVDLAARKVVATLPVGSGPRKISLQQGTGAMTRYEASSAAAATGFAGQPVQPAAPARAGDVQIHMRAFAFGPASATVAAGHRVTWIDDDPVPHTATAQTTHGKLWDTGQVVPGAAITVTMTKPGTFQYQCDDHPFMLAKLVVTP